MENNKELAIEATRSIFNIWNEVKDCKNMPAPEDIIQLLIKYKTDEKSKLTKAYESGFHNALAFTQGCMAVWASKFLDKIKSVHEEGMTDDVHEMIDEMNDIMKDMGK